MRVTGDLLTRRGPAPAAPRRPGRRGTLLGLGIGTAALAALIGVRSLTAGWDDLSLPEALRDFVTLSTSVIIESLPFVFLGVLLSVIVQIWVPDRVIHRILPRNRTARRAVLSLLGVLLPVCECGNVPLARGLVIKGVGVPEAATFLLAAPILNPVTIITTYQAFGWNDGILAGRIVGGFVIANLVGWLFSRHPEPERLLTPEFSASCQVHRDHPVSGRRMRRAVAGFAEETATMLPALVIGSLIAGAIQVGVSRDLLGALGANPIWSVLALMALAFIVAICSNVDAFFILAFGATFTPGSIVAFLVFGAMVDVKMIAMMRTTFTTRALVVLVSVVALTTLVLGFGVNLLV